MVRAPAAGGPGQGRSARTRAWRCWPRSSDF